MHNRPASSVTKLQDVFITVSGGVAYVAQAPESVKVHIIDYDDLGSDFGRTFSKLAPEARSFYLKLESDSVNLTHR